MTSSTGAEKAKWFFSSLYVRGIDPSLNQHLSFMSGNYWRLVPNVLLSRNVGLVYGPGAKSLEFTTTIRLHQFAEPNRHLF